MKTIKIIAVTFLITIVALGCIYLFFFYRPNEPEEIEYITEEELFQYIKTHDVGVTVKDFEGIDTDEFIKSYLFRAGYEINSDFDFKNAIDMYWVEKQIEKIEPYLAYELMMVDSTDQEFEVFLNEFTERVSESDRTIIPTELWKGSWSNFNIDIGDNQSIDLIIGQTKNLNDLWVSSQTKVKVIEGDKDRKESAYLDFGIVGEWRDTRQFYYSASNKYFMFFVERQDPLDDFEIIKAFYEAG